MYFWDENQVNRTKMEDKTFRHQMPAQLRFSDVDRFGHVNNNVYFSLFDMSKSQYLFDVVGKDIYERLAIVVAHIESNFITPVYYPEGIYIYGHPLPAWVTRVSRFISRRLITGQRR